ncbi:hypothetical protein ACJJTC_015250, partial [Scirpophaga incertulas]
MAQKDNTKVKEREFIIECIQLYRELSSLWNVKSKEYHDRDKKKADYETLLSKYKEMFPEASKDDVKKKFNSLRTNYRKELKKHLQSMKSGSGTDDIYQPTLWYFNEMSFLRDQETASDSQSSMDMDTQSTIRSPGGESEHSKLDNNYTQGTAPSLLQNLLYSSRACFAIFIPKTKDKKLKRKSDDELMQLAVNRLRQKPGEYENWALSCAADLKKMEPTQQIFAKSAIAAIIMEGQLGLLHRNSVKINSPTVTITPSPTRSTPTPTNYNSTPSPRYFINYSPQQNSEHPPEELPHYEELNTPKVTINPSPSYARSTSTPTNYNSTPSPRYSELPPEELPHYQQNMSRGRLSGCSATNLTHRLYSFPKDDNLQALWLSFLVPFNSDLLGLSKDQLLNKRVCQKHFDRSQLDGEGKRLKGGYPCLFSAKEMEHGVPLSYSSQANDHNYSIVEIDEQNLEIPLLLNTYVQEHSYSMVPETPTTSSLPYS